VRKRDARVFDFLTETQLDFSLNDYLGKLIDIDPSKTVDHVLKRYGRLKHMRIVDTCV